MVTADQTSAMSSSAPRPGRSFVRWDVALSTGALVLAGLVVAFGVSRAVLLVTYLGECVGCSPSGALVSVGGPVVVAIAAGFAGLVLTVLRIMDRRPSWPFALATLAVCTLAVVVERYASAAFLAS